MKVLEKISLGLGNYGQAQPLSYKDHVPGDVPLGVFRGDAEINRGKELGQITDHDYAMETEHNSGERTKMAIPKSMSRNPKSGLHVPPRKKK